MSKQTVFRSTEGKSYKDIKSLQEDIPEVDKNEVLVKIKAVALNFRDLVVADGRYPFPIKKNVVPCSDAAGEVVKVGSAVKNLQVGDRVVNLFDPTNFYGVQKDWENGYGAPQDGVLQQYKTMLADTVVKLPSDTHLSYAEAASLVCTGITAWNSLYGGERFTAGQTVLLLGTGGVSITTLILARAAGAKTIITSSSEEKLKFVKEKYGVDHTVNYKVTPDWEKEVLKLTNGEGVDYIIENGGSGTIAKSIASVKRGGIIAIVGFLSQPDVMPDVTSMILDKSCTVRGIAVGSKQLLEELVRFVHVKKLRMPVEKEFGFSEEEVHAAFGHLEGQSHVGKIVINVE